MNGDQVFAIVIVSVGAVALIQMMRIWVNRRRGGDAPDRRLAEIESRLERLQQAVDSIAIETERISEGQRFTTRLLTDRPGDEAGVPGARR